MTESTSTFELRELGLGALLDRAIRIFRTQFQKFIGVLAVIYVPIVLINLVIQLAIGQFGVTTESGQLSPTELVDQLPAVFGALGLLLLLSFFTYYLLQGLAPIALHTAIKNTLTGKPFTIFGIFSQARPELIQMLLAQTILIFFYVVGFVLAVIVPVAGWLVGPGLLIFFTMVVNNLVPVVIVMEGKSAWPAILRAWDLARSRFWWTFGFFIVVAVFGYVLVSGPSVLLGAAMTLIIPSAGLSASATNAINVTLQSLISLGINLVYLPIFFTFVSLVYLDTRVRKEGLDLIMETVEGSSPDEVSDQIAATAPAAPRSELLRLNEAGYFSIVTVGLFSFCVLIYLLIIAISLPFAFLLGGL
jgi:hypothetical protein